MRGLLSRRRTPGVSETCEYAVEHKLCGEASAGELRGHTMDHKRPWGLCLEHLKREHHPLDLWDKLHRW